MPRDDQKKPTTAAGRSSKRQETTPTKPARTAGSSPPASPPRTADSTSTAKLAGAGAVGGIVGAVLGVLGFQALQEPQGLAPADAARIATIEQAASSGVADLEAKIASLEADFGSKVDAATSDITTRLSSIEGSAGQADGLAKTVASLQQAGDATSATIASLQKTNDATSSALASLQEASDATTAQVSALAAGRDQVLAAATDNMKQEIWTATATAINSAIAPVTQQLSTIDDRVSALDGQLTKQASEQFTLIAATQQELNTSISDVRKSVDDVVSNVGSDRDAAKQVLASLDSKVGTVETGMSTLSADVTDLAGKVTALEPQIAGIAAGVEASRAAGLSGAATLLAVSDVETAARSQSSLEEPAARLRELTKDWPDFGPLIDTIETSAAGSRSNSQLISELDDIEAGLAPAVGDASAGTAPDAGWLGQTVSNISGLVGAPPAAAAVEDDGAGKAIESARQALRDGELSAALESTNGLDVDTVSGLAEWRDQVESRLGLDAALTELGSKLRQHYASSK